MDSQRRQGSSSARSPLMRRPNGGQSVNVRVVLAVALCLFCPPLGILYMWRAGVFVTRGRVLMTLLSAVVLTFFLVRLTPKQTQETIVPFPSAPQRVTAVSQDNVVTALSNLDQLLGLVDDSTADYEADDSVSTEDELIAQQMYQQQQEAIYDTVVYAVYSNAKYYHAAMQCAGQTNRREFTVRDALREGLGACAQCNPAVPD